MTSGYAQGSRRLWAEKVFNVSLHRSGTKSVHDLLVRSGVSSVHWPSTFEGVDYETRVAGHENDRPYVASLLAPVIASVTGVGDVPIGALYDELDAMHPESAFILMYRSPFDWVRSLRHHIGERDLEPFERTQYWRYLLSQPTSLSTVSDCQLRATFLTHCASVLSYFEGSNRCLFVDLQDPEAGQTICRFLELPARPLRHVNSPLSEKPAFW